MGNLNRVDMDLYKMDNIEILSLSSVKESVRQRPYMYLGRDGLHSFLSLLLIDCIEFCKTDEIIFEIAIATDNDFSLRLSSGCNLTLLGEQFMHRYPVKHDLFHIMLLNVITERLDVICINDREIEVKFSFDKAVIPDRKIDYFKLSEKIFLTAILNRRTQIIIVDNRQKYLNQNYYHFPEGIFYLFNRIKMEVLGKPQFDIVFDGVVNSNSYQIGLAWRTDWYPDPYIISYANDVHTVNGGSMVDGILDGLTTGGKSYVRKNNLTTFKIKRKKFLNGLIMVCCVRGEKFSYGGNFKETLEDDNVKREVKKIIAKLASDFLDHHKETADKFLLRFDTSQMVSGMFQ